MWWWSSNITHTPEIGNSSKPKRYARCGVRTHANIRSVDLESTALDHSANLALRTEIGRNSSTVWGNQKLMMVLGTQKRTQNNSGDRKPHPQHHALPQQQIWIWIWIWIRIRIFLFVNWPHSINLTPDQPTNQPCMHAAKIKIKKNWIESIRLQRESPFPFQSHFFHLG